VVVGRGARRQGRIALVTALTRRAALAVAAGAAAFGASGFRAAAQTAVADDAGRHGMSAFGDLKYPANFSHFEYANPSAPKGGTFSHVGSTRMFNQGLLTFNTLNSYILRGDAAQGMELTFASLMTRASDEPDAMYGLVASAVRISEDGLIYRYTLRPQARFHDGTPIRTSASFCATSPARRLRTTPMWC
jgi:microcin C transport system substrate-binding protein